MTNMDGYGCNGVTHICIHQVLHYQCWPSDGSTGRAFLWGGVSVRLLEVSQHWYVKLFKRKQGSMKCCLQRLRSSTHCSNESTVIPVRVVKGKTDSLSISSAAWIKPWEEGTISTVSSSIVGWSTCSSIVGEPRSCTTQNRSWKCIPGSINKNLHCSAILHSKQYTPDEFHLIKVKCQHLRIYFSTYRAPKNKMRRILPCWAMVERETLQGGDKTFPCKSNIMSVKRNN